LEENWCALFLCINKEISTDKALILMGVTKDCKSGSRNYLKHSDTERKQIYMLHIKGETYSEIAKSFGMSRGQVATMIRQYKIKTARTPTKVVQAAN
jgi:Mor family transcriptional regulator